MRHAGLAWGVKVAFDSGTDSERRNRIASVLRDRVWTAWADGQHELAPEGSLYGQGLSRNAYACYPQSEMWAYWPSHEELARVCDRHDCWLRDVEGEWVHTNSGLRIFDVRHPAIRETFITQTGALVERFKASVLLLDELHDHHYPSFLTGRDDLNDGIPGVEGSVGWDESTRMMLRRSTAGRRVVKNGTFPLDLSAMFCGEYIQRAHVKVDTEDRMKGSVARGFTHTCIQVPADESLFWQAKAADYPGVSIQEIPEGVGQFDMPPPSPVFTEGVRPRLEPSGQVRIVRTEKA